MPIHGIETVRDFAEDFVITDGLSLAAVCVDDRNTAADARKIARGGADIGFYEDVISVIVELGLPQPPELIAARTHAFRVSRSGVFTIHTDRHTEDLQPWRSIVNPDIGIIGCRYLSLGLDANVSRQFGIDTRALKRGVEDARSRNMELQILDGERTAGAVFVIVDPTIELPHQSGQVGAFKHSRARDDIEIDLLVQALDMPDLSPDLVKRARDRHLIETLLAIPEASGLPVYEISRHDEEIVVEQVNVIGPQLRSH